MASDPGQYGGPITRQARRARPVTPNDARDLPDGASRGLYVGASGDLTVVLAAGGAPVTLVGHPVGYAPLQVRRVLATGTTAASLVALY